MKYIKVRDVKSPERGTSRSAGIDFFVPYGVRRVLRPGTDTLIPSGIKIAIPEGYMLMGANKSGVVTSKSSRIDAGIKPKSGTYDSVVMLGACIVDEDFQGEIFIHLVNVGNHIVNILPGTKIAQLILVPVSYEGLEEVAGESELFESKSERGTGMLGSTGSF